RPGQRERVPHRRRPRYRRRPITETVYFAAPRVLGPAGNVRRAAGSSAGSGCWSWPSLDPSPRPGAVGRAGGVGLGPAGILRCASGQLAGPGVLVLSQPGTFTALAI